MPTLSRYPIRIAIVFGALGWSACAVLPPATTGDLNDVVVPEAWQAATDEGDDEGPAWPDNGRWWQVFGEPRLDALVTEALAGSFDLAAAAAGVEAAAARARIAGADRLPQIAASLDASRRQQVFVGLPIPGTDGVLKSQSSSVASGLSVSWEADLWGRIRAGRFAATADAAAAALDLDAARLSIAAQTAKAFFALREASGQLAIAEETLANRERSVARTWARYRRGVAPPVEVRLARTERAQVMADLALRRRLLDQSRRQLEVLLGRYPAADPALGGEGVGDLAMEDSALPEPPAAVPALLPSELIRRRPDLVAAERRLAAAGWRIAEARAALYPRLTLTGSAGITSDDLGDLVDSDFSVWSIAGGLLAPIFQGGRLRAAVSFSEASRERVLAEYVGQTLRAFAEVENALGNDADLVAQENALGEAADEARRAAELARDRYAAGIGGPIGFLQVLDSDRSAFRADSQRLAVRGQRLANRIDLFVALGGGFGEP